MGSEEQQYKRGETVLTPLSDLTVRTRDGQDIVLGAARVTEEMNDDGMVAVAFDAVQGTGLERLADEEKHVAAGRVTGPQTAVFYPKELEYGEKRAVPAPDLGEVPSLR